MLILQKFLVEGLFMRSCENKISCSLNEDIGKLILRVSIAVLMLFHGFAKLQNGIDGIKFLVTSAGLPEFFASSTNVSPLSN